MCQRIVAAHGEDERIVTEIRCHQPGPVDRPVDESNVELAVDDCPSQIAGCTPGQTKGDSRVGFAEGRKEGGQVHHAKRLNGPHVQLAAQNTAETGHRVAALVHRGESCPERQVEEPVRPGSM